MVILQDLNSKKNCLFFFLFEEVGLTWCALQAASLSSELKQFLSIGLFGMAFESAIGLAVKNRHFVFSLELFPYQNLSWNTFLT
jgi:hypothetical protein